jgi:hypothetical protein
MSLEKEELSDTASTPIFPSPDKVSKAFQVTTTIKKRSMTVYENQRVL